MAAYIHAIWLLAALIFMVLYINTKISERRYKKKYEDIYKIYLDEVHEMNMRCIGSPQKKTHLRLVK